MPKQKENLMNHNSKRNRIIDDDESEYEIVDLNKEQQNEEVASWHTTNSEKSESPFKYVTEEVDKNKILEIDKTWNIQSKNSIIQSPIIDNSTENKLEIKSYWVWGVKDIDFQHKDALKCKNNDNWKYGKYFHYKWLKIQIKKSNFNGGDIDRQNFTCHQWKNDRIQASLRKHLDYQKTLRKEHRQTPQKVKITQNNDAPSPYKEKQGDIYSRLGKIWPENEEKYFNYNETVNNLSYRELVLNGIIKPEKHSKDKISQLKRI